MKLGKKVCMGCGAEAGEPCTCNSPRFKFRFALDRLPTDEDMAEISRDPYGPLRDDYDGDWYVLKGREG
jgi:hypothetical protein